LFVLSTQKTSREVKAPESVTTSPEANPSTAVKNTKKDRNAVARCMKKKLVSHKIKATSRSLYLKIFHTELLQYELR
ncbi:MAG: hypothetical protein ACI9SF_000414, partial [Candidatus Nanohaloarchaea archaeon]